MAGVLYIVATPIGNLEDITARALRVLREVDVIAAEDTRETRKLLSRYEIATSLTSYYDSIEASKAPLLIEQLKAGKKIALVSDAGTPMLSDPGARLVRGAVEHNIRVIPIPGPSALTAALSASGLAVERFVFEGFLPAKRTERRERLSLLRNEQRTLFFFEAPHRVQETLRDFLEILGDRQMVLAREVTKVHEEFLRGTVSEVIAESEQRRLKGEITLIASGSSETEPASLELLEADIHGLRQKGLRIKEIAQLLGEKYGLPKRDIYRMALGTKGKME
ncbi:MAG: 16S rRNA (cytidine(1402)-2'-O)-methyltransferase [Candidatus Binatia bacterium]